MADPPPPSALVELQQAAAALELSQSSLLPGLQCEAVAEIGSTNTELMRRAREGRAAPALMVALHQSAGRGRMGRPWQSEPGASLTFSLALPLAPADFGGLSLAVGVALAEALEIPGARHHSSPPAAAHAGERPASWLRLKWPNDLVCNSADGALRKLGGILIETQPLGGRRMVAIGIGVNLRPQAAMAATALPPVAHLAEWWPAPTPATVLLQAVPPLVQALALFERAGFAAFAEAYGQRDALAGRRVRTTDPALPEGLAAGVAASGALLVQRADGTLHPVVSGEVSVRPVADG